MKIKGKLYINDTTDFVTIFYDKDDNGCRCGGYTEGEGNSKHYTCEEIRNLIEEWIESDKRSREISKKG